MATRNTSMLLLSCHGNNNNNYSRIGGDGSETPTVKALDKSIFIMALALGISLFLLSLACLVFNCLLRQNRIIKMSSPRLNMVIASGGILGSVCCVLEGTDYFLVVDSFMSHFVCHLRYALMSVSFSLVYGPMVGRTWRVNRIFKLAGYKRVVIRDQMLLMYTAILLFIDVTICLIWFLVDPLEFQYTTRFGSMTLKPPCSLRPADLLVVPVCTSQWPALWTACFVTTKLPFLIAGLRESWWTKGDILPTINDSASLVVSILATISMATVAAMTSQAFPAYPDVTNGCVVGCLWIAAVIAVVAVFLPKLLLWKRTPNSRVSRVSISSTSSTKAVLHSFGQLEAELSTANTEIETLKVFIKEKENSIEKLQRLLSDAEENLTQFNIDNAVTSPGTDQSEYGSVAAQAKVKAGVLWLSGDHIDCPGLQDHEEYCSCNSDVNIEQVSSSNDHANNTNNKNNNNTTNNNNNFSKPSQHQQPSLKSILHHTSRPETNSTTTTSNNNDNNFSNQNTRYTKHGHGNIKPPTINNTGPWKMNEHNNSTEYTNRGSNACDVHSRNAHNTGNNNNYKLSVMEKPILKRCTSPSNDIYHYMNSSAPGNKDLGSSDYKTNIINNKIIDNKKYKLPVTNSHMDLPSDSERQRAGADDLLFDSTNDLNPPLTALQKRYLRRRRSSTSSIASLSKLNRLRSDLNEALQLSQALQSGWCKDFQDMERYRRQVKMVRRARRKSVPGFQNITESIMASYDFQRTADNETFISDCLSTSEWSSDITRNSKMSLASSSLSSKSLNKGRRHSECNFYFPYDRTGNLDDVNIRLDVINNSNNQSNNDYNIASNNHEFDYNVIPTIHEPRQSNYDVRNDARSQRTGIPLGTISGTIGPAALYGHPDYEQLDSLRHFPLSRVHPDAFVRGYNETASDFLGPTTPRPVLTSDSLYPPTERQRRWSGGTEFMRRKDDSGFYRGERGRGEGRETQIDRRIMLGGREAGMHSAYNNHDTATRIGITGEEKNNRSPLYPVGREYDRGVRIETFTLPEMRDGSVSNPKYSGVKFADSMARFDSDRKRGAFNEGETSLTISGGNPDKTGSSLTVRPKFHRSVSDNILSRRDSQGVACPVFGLVGEARPLNEREKSEVGESCLSAKQCVPISDRVVFDIHQNAHIRARETTGDLRHNNDRISELSIVPTKAFSNHNNDYNNSNEKRVVLSPMTSYQQRRCDEDNDDDLGSQININVTVGARARNDHGHMRQKQGEGSRQSFT